MNSSATRLKADLILLLAAFVWGSGFVAQRYAAFQIDTFTFNGWRFLIGAVVIFAVTTILNRRNPGSRRAPVPRWQIPWMILAGALLFAAAGLQQAGLATTTISNASFITGLYVVLVPVIISLVWRQQVSWQTWAAVVLSVFGVMLLSLQSELRIVSGDALEMASAVMWSLQIILVGWLSKQGADVLHFSIVEFATCGVLNLGVAAVLHGGLPGGEALLSGTPEMNMTILAIVYSALFPIAMGFSLQIAGQRHAPTTDASLIMSSEAVFGTLFGFMILGEALTPQQIAGCIVIMAAIVLAQIRTSKPLETGAVSLGDPQ